MKKVFSLASVNLTIDNEYFGQITISGGGKLLGSVGYSFANNLFDVTSTADGGAAVSFNKSLAGSVSISFTQTSPKIDEITDFILKCRNEPEKAEATITCRDNSGNINFFANGAFPSKLPDNSMGESPSSRSFSFECCEIIIGEAR